MTMKNWRLLGVLALSAMSGRTCHSTDSTEVGVLTRKITVLGKAGVQQETYPPGATYFFPALITDWNVYNVALQNLAMVRTLQKGGRPNATDDVEFKTHDGNDIAVDVTVAWRIDTAKTPCTFQHVGGSTEEVKENLVRPACRSIVRDVLNTMTSEEYYVSDKRFQKAEEAREMLAKVLSPEGVIVERVILGEHHFHPEYERVIHDKKLAEQYRGADGERGPRRAAGGAAEPRDGEGAGLAEDRHRDRRARSGEAARRRRLLPLAAGSGGDPGGEEGAGAGHRQDQPGDERRGRAHDGEAERRGRAPRQADPLPSLRREIGRPADDEPQRAARALRVHGDFVEGDGEGPRRFEVTCLKLTLEYDGSAFVGWQVQPNGRSVQEELEKGIERLCAERIRISPAPAGRMPGCTRGGRWPRCGPGASCRSRPGRRG